MSGAGVDVLVEHVSKSFENGRVRALEDVSFRVEAGEIVALTGPSGSGKSTLLQLIGALDRPDAGRIVVGDADLARVPGTEYRASTVGFVFQLHDLIPTLDASENVQVPLIGRTDRAERERRAHELLVEVGLGHRRSASVTTLSGGERQRVAIARALANRPRLLLADEPTGSLDPETGDQIVALLRSLRSERGVTVLLVTNDPDVAVRADRMLRLRGGRIEEATPVAAPPPASA